MTLTHFNQSGDAHMVDIANKAETHRYAQASGRIVLLPETLAQVVAGQNRKGDVLGIARIAAIQAAKRTAELVPLCHPVALTRITVDFDMQTNGILCVATTETLGRTGVEMEALMAVQAALLTIYDMCKAVDKGMVMTDIRLLEKRGGQSGHWLRETLDR